MRCCYKVRLQIEAFPNEMAVLAILAILAVLRLVVLDAMIRFERGGCQMKWPFWPQLAAFDRD